MSVDIPYVRGWEDCLDIVKAMLTDIENIQEAQEQISKLSVLVRQKKFKKIRTEFGAVGFF